MKVRHVIAAAFAAIALAVPSFSQDVVTTPAPVSTSAPIPHYVRYSGTLSESGSKPVQMRFALYENQTGGQPVWSEIQTVNPVEGKYAVLLGAGTENGLPQSVFSAAQARWLGITVGAGQEQPRTILLATPYSLESSDAQTLAGHPASDFVLAGSNPNPAPKSDTKKPNTNTDISLIDVTSGLTINNGGTGPTVTMGIDATKIPFLASANTFTATQTISAGNLAIPATTSKTNGVITSGGKAIFQSYSSVSGANNLFLGAGSGNFSNSGKNNTGVGNVSLSALTTAAGNMALGTDSLGKTTSGPYNTAIGAFAGYYNITGGYNTFIGNSAGPPSGSSALTNATAIGASSVVNESNAVVLGGTGPYAVSVGIGTATPQYTLDVQGTANFTGAVNYGSTQYFDSSYTSSDDGLITVDNTETTCSPYCAGIWSYATTNTNGYGVIGAGYYGTYGYGGNIGAFGSGSEYGVYGDSSTIGVYGSSPAVGLYGVTTGTALADNGLSAAAPTGSGSGAYGLNGTASTIGGSFGGSAGVWGDSSSSTGVVGTSDDDWAGHFINNSTSGLATLLSWNEDTTGAGISFFISNGTNDTDCYIDESANMYCSGNFTGNSVTSDNRVVETYGVQSSESWMEDAGSGKLTAGVGHVALDSTFTQIANATVDYHVFLTPNGDCKGLYVASKTPTGFDVRELGGGSSDVSFDYRIMVKRHGSESLRLRDVTARNAAIRKANTPQGTPVAHTRPHAPAALPPPPAATRPSIKPAAATNRAALTASHN